MKRVLLLLFMCMGAYVVSWAQMAGSGTEEDPHQVRTADDLFDIRMNLSAHYVLMNDIDLTQWIEEESPNSGWNPIGNASTGFTGVFDGDGHTIRGLYINKPGVSYVGLFGYVEDATIKNVVLVSTFVAGNSNVGGLVGKGLNMMLENIKIQDVVLSGSNNIGGCIGNIETNNKERLQCIDNIIIENVAITGASQIGGMVGSASNNASQYINNTLYRYQSILQNTLAKNITITATSGDIGGIIGKTSIDVQVLNAKIVNPKIAGTNNIGGIGGYMTHAEHCVVINPNLTGEDYVGGVTGTWISEEIYNRLYIFSVIHNIVIGGQISGNDYVGGIIGKNTGYHLIKQYNKYKQELIGNYSSSIIIANNYVGGICGYQEGSSWYYSGSTELYVPDIQNNRSDCDIVGNEYVGGVIGYWASNKHGWNGVTISGKGMAYIDNNIVCGSVCGTQNVGGIISPRVNSFDQWSCSNNVFAANLLSSSLDTPYRIFQYATSDNYALTTTEVRSNNNIIEVEDGGDNGISYGLRTLKRKNTYVGFGYDFNNTWAIVDGESFPYNIYQSTPPTIEKCSSGAKSSISGTADGDGMVYVFVGDRMIEGVVANGTWSVELDDVSEGDIVSVSAETKGLKPSVMVSTEAVHEEDTFIMLDENSSDIPEASEDVNVRVLRTIKANEWSTICLPFTATGEQVKNAWGDDVQLATFTAWESEEDNDGAIVGINVKFTSASANDGIEANTPMLIRVSETTTTATFDGVTIEPEDEPVVQVGKKASERGWFRGTYSVMKVPEENLFLSGNNFWYSTGNTTIKGYRGYFEFRDVLDAYYDGSEVKVNVLIDDMETGIETIDHSPLTIHRYYNLAGQRVGKNYKGIVIEKGKKILY